MLEKPLANLMEELCDDVAIRLPDTEKLFLVRPTQVSMMVEQGYFDVKGTRSTLRSSPVMNTITLKNYSTC